MRYAIAALLGGTSQGQCGITLGCQPWDELCGGDGGPAGDGRADDDAAAEGGADAGPDGV